MPVPPHLDDTSNVQFRGDGKMRQVTQDLRTGEIRLEKAPLPVVRPGALLIETRVSLISAGTERSLLEFGQANLLNKARKQPERVRQVLQKVRSDGLAQTLQTVRSKLAEPLSLGYSNVGRVISVGDGVSGFEVGDRVVSNGHHAEAVLVPRNLCARIPPEVSDQDASFTVVGSIGLHALRLSKPTLGESFSIFGLGLIGLLTGQIGLANGLRVIGFDPKPERVRLGRQLGLTAYASQEVDVVSKARDFSRGEGVDGVLITATTPSHELIRQAAEMCRKRGRIVVAGVVGMHLERSLLYEKEISVQVSCSYGPGRYDRSYEEKGNDYPPGYVRWTEERNFEALLNLLERGKLQVSPLISRVYPLERASEAYRDLITGEPLGLLLEYAPEASPSAEAGTVLSLPSPRPIAGRPQIGLVGTGSFARSVLLPALKIAGAELRWVASEGGLSASRTAQEHSIPSATSDYREILKDPEVQALIITTPDALHAPLVIESLQAGKHVFVEKPLCQTREELREIREAYRTASAAGLILMVGFNRRFAPLSDTLKELVDRRAGPLSMQYLCNAGTVDSRHWLRDPEMSRGRLTGEVCHFIDYFRFLTSCPILEVSSFAMPSRSVPADSWTVQLRGGDGSLGSVNYFARGSRSFPKETIHIFFDGSILILNNFRSLTGAGKVRVARRFRTRGGKGHREEVASFLAAIAGQGPRPIPFEELVNSTEATLAASESASEKRFVRIVENGGFD